MIKKILASFIVIIPIVVTVFVNMVASATHDVPRNLLLPFASKVISCGWSISRETGQYVGCSYDWIWWGVVASLVFWTMLFVLAYFIGRKNK
jgi:hypothetical protein